MNISDRLLVFYEYIKTQEKLTQKDLAEKLGIDPTQLSALFKGRANAGLTIIEKFINLYPFLNANWLITGIGEMNKNVNYSSFGDGNNISGSNTGNISGGQFVGGNFINVELPETGKQKIIKPDGSIIIAPVSPDGDYQDKDNPARNENLSLLEKIELQRQLIESLQAQITMLKGGKG